MEQTPKSMRLQIGFFGRTNVGKSTLLNMLAGQDVSITSPVPGTTTDVVEKAMELLPIGPVLFLDTAGVDDSSELSAARLKKTEKVFNRADLYVLIIQAQQWGVFEEQIVAAAKKRKAPLIVVVNKVDLLQPTPEFITSCKSKSDGFLCSNALDVALRERLVAAFKAAVIATRDDDALQPALIGDLLMPGDIAVLVVPIDSQAPKGRLILPQVQTIRDILDSDAATLVVKELAYARLLTELKHPPALVVGDSQIVMKMVADTPPGVRCTTFSILMARWKGDLCEEARGAATIDHLKDGDAILIAEACSHHAAQDDIGRVKIPRWLRQYTGVDLKVDIFSGRDYPENLDAYALIMHCGACMLTRREMLLRIEQAKAAGVPVTNYGVGISKVQGVLERVLSPFPAALEAYNDAVKKLEQGDAV